MESEGNIGPVIIMGRKRPREFETDTQRVKREKAAERQRRKRERDRAQAQADAASQAQAVAPVAMIAFSTPEQFHHHFAAHLQQTLAQVPTPLLAAVTCGEYVPPPPALLSPPPPAPSPPPPPTAPESPQPPMTQEEMDRRDKLRAAARERQRKHRSVVKQRKMRELGLDVDVMQQATMDELQYRSELGPAHLAPHMFDEFAAVQALGGQTFASTLLLSFSCAPLLKAHLLRTLSMTNEELASLEPIIAEAWDRWNAQRQVHYAEAAKNGVPPPAPGHHPGFSVDLTGHHGVGVHMHPPPHLSHSQLQYLHFQPPHQPPPQPIVKHNQPPTSPQPPPPPSSEEHETPPQESSPPQTPQTPQPQEQQESPPQDSPPPSPAPEQRQSPSPPSQPQSPLSPQASPSLTPQPGHPPPPTFAAPNGPCLSPQPPPPPTTAAVNDALDFRSRFWLSFNAKRILGSSGLLGASARASTFRDPYGDSAAAGLGKGGVRELYAPSAATRARARARRGSGDCPESTGSVAASSSGTSSSRGGSGDTPDAVEDMNIDPHLEDEDE